MGRKWALLIGNSRYDDKEFPPLEKSVADVEALAAVLRDPSIGAFDEVFTLIDQPMTKISQAIEHFFQEKKHDDLLLLYLTGHGKRAGGKLYFVCKDTQKQALRSTTISADVIRDIMGASSAKQQVIIIDTCHAAAFVKGAKGAVDIAEEATRQLAGSGRAILVAAGATESAWEGDKSTPTSIFTFYLVQGLITGEADRDNDGKIAVDEWFDYTYEQVRNANVDQTPRKQVEDQQGSLFVARNPHHLKAGEAYRSELESFWATHKPLDLELLEQLWISVNEKKLGPSEAENIEREVMGDTKDAIFKQQYEQERVRSRYHDIVQKAWEDKRLDEQEIALLAATALGFKLTQDETGPIEREVMGDTKDVIWKAQQKVQQTPQEQVRSLSQYHDIVQKAWEDKRLDEQEIALLAATALGFKLTQDETGPIEREVMGDTKDVIWQQQGRMDMGFTEATAATMYFNEVAKQTGAHLAYTKMQDYETRAAAERQQIQMDAKAAVSTSVGRAARTIAAANEQKFDGWLQIIDGNYSGSEGIS